MEATTLHISTLFEIDQVSPLIFGGFLEHLGRSIYEGVFDPDSAHVVYYLGLVLERLGSDEAANAFERANALDPNHYPLPIEMSRDEFERVVEIAIENLPRSIRDYITDVPILLEDFPSRELIAAEGVSPQILGLFVGSPRTEASSTSQALDLDRVLLFVKNHEKICRDREDLIEQVQITVRHEIGHYLGLDEEDMDRLGLA